ncbi:transporter substrate-binding domain-containing protein [Leuconostoc rapi]|uniref:transporter substrate-binding domain-containing protein n=1 Tax=Leuconostoc rapi TaxID=1406906 RepID=UPI00195B5C1A|nr:transporter substrate-binding domain-containing protein [Leuconostoc rapi]MBM7435283.1 cystine transport system substrate-binding protein [Leuconostoc rapi]
MSKLRTYGITGMIVILVAVGGYAATAHHNKAAADTQVKLVKPKTLTIGLEGTYAPFSYRQDGQLKGFEVDLGKKISKELGLKAHFVPTAWDGLIAGVGAKKFDIVLNDVAVTPERQVKYRFSTPYLYSSEVLVVKKTNTDIKSYQDVRGRVLAESVGSNNEVIAKKFGAKTISSSEFTNSVALIKQGRAEGAFNDSGAFATYIKDNPRDAQVVKAIKVPTSASPASKIAPLINKNNAGLQKKVDGAISNLKKDGTVKTLAVKYFGTDLTKKP